MFETLTFACEALLQTYTSHVLSAYIDSDSDFQFLSFA